MLISLAATGIAQNEDNSPVRFVSLGRSTSDEWRLGGYPCSAKGRIPIGGGPSKNSQKISHKNAIAGAFTQHGYDMRWVSTTVESLIHRLISHSETPIYFGYMPMRGSKVSAIQKLCQEAQIEIPTPVAPSIAKFATGIPSKKRQSTVPNPLDFTVAPGFFLNDNSAPPVLQSIRGQMHGLGLVTPDQILPWLCENQTISSDELGAVVIGLMPLATDLIAEEVTFPCQDADGQSVLLTGTLVQMGGKKISLTKGGHNRLLRKPVC